MEGKGGSPALSLREGTTEMPSVPGSSLRSGGAQLLCAFFGVSLHEAKPGVLPSLWCHLCVTCWHQDRPRGYRGLYPGFLESRCAGRLAAAGGDAALGPRPQISASHPGKAPRGGEKGPALVTLASELGPPTLVSLWLGDRLWLLQGVPTACGACCDTGMSPLCLGVLAAPRCCSPWVLVQPDPNPALGGCGRVKPAPSCDWGCEVPAGR